MDLGCIPIVREKVGGDIFSQHGCTRTFTALHLDKASFHVVDCCQSLSKVFDD
jgi:hypothetical protein